MLRNVILFISTAGVLVLLFIGYSTLVDTPMDESAADPSAETRLPTRTAVSEENKLKIGPVEIEPGHKMVYVNYDQHGIPTDYLKCEDWEKVPGTHNEITVRGPELMIRLPSGMIARITADTSQISAERVQRESVRPKFGSLTGHARILIDRETGFDRTPIEQRPEDQIAIETEELKFDLERGELKAEGLLHVLSSEFEISGSGLHFIWNQPENRVEQLTIRAGRELVLQDALLSALDGGARLEVGEDSDTDTKPDAVRRDSKPRKQTTYKCRIAGDVVVEQWVGDRQSGGLRADELRILFDLGGRTSGMRQSRQPAASAPATQPTNKPEQRLIVRWSGPLTLEPVDEPPQEQPRRELEIIGTPVVAEMPNGSIECSRLVYHDQDKRLWLYPVDGRQVMLEAAEGLSVRSSNIFVDLEQNIIKLIGNVLFASHAAEELLEIRCDLWAELHLRGSGVEGEAAVLDNPFASRPPELATFVGNVRVSYDDQLLRAHRFDAHFREPTPRDEGLESSAGAPAVSEAEAKKQPASGLQALLDTAEATGDVRLTVGGTEGRGDWRSRWTRHLNLLRDGLLSALLNENEGAASRRSARADHEQSLACAKLLINFEQENGETFPGNLEAVGAVEVIDRDSRFGARGRALDASFVGRELDRAVIHGTADRPAAMLARGYALRGPAIEIDNEERTLHVDGNSHLAFSTRRTLQGRTRSEGERITVSSSDSLHIDDRQSTVEFAGQVAAAIGNEKLLADTMTLYLEDSEPEPGRNLPSSKLSTLVSALRREISGAGNGGRNRRESLITMPRTSDRGSRKRDLSRVLARNAMILSEVREEGQAEPLVFQSVGGPELEIDAKQRLIRTIGITNLLMNDRRTRETADTSRPPLAVPSALMNRGPSQTAMRCYKGLTYQLGSEGPGRVDSLLLEGGVEFRRVTGTEMVGYEQILPDATTWPTLKSRNTLLTCDRLEGEFRAGDSALASAAAGAASNGSTVSFLNAVGNVRLEDRIGANKRSVYAEQLEFDNTRGIIRVLGSEAMGIEARVYDEDTENDRFSNPASGPEIIIDLNNNTIRTKRITGQTGG